MEHPDIHKTVANSINNIHTLISYCSSDKYSRNLCSNRAFWESQFNRLGLPLDENIRYLKCNWY